MMSEIPRVLVNGRVGATLSPFDRGFCYGDGVFETVLCRAGHRVLWSRHMQRLRSSCARLHLAAPSESLLAQEVAEVCADTARAVVRITVSRGIAERGYGFSSAVEPTRVVAAFAAPAVLDTTIRVRWCDLVLGDQPALAGMKHLNRLEAIMARAEWSDPDIGEGLLCDARDKIICAVSSNLFAVIDAKLVTPDLTRCGVAGVLRAEILDAHPACQVREIDRRELMNASEVFLGNSVRGISSVHAIEGRSFFAGEHTHFARQLWSRVCMPEGGAE